MVARAVRLVAVVVALGSLDLLLGRGWLQVIWVAAAAMQAGHATRTVCAVGVAAMIERGWQPAVCQEPGEAVSLDALGPNRQAGDRRVDADLTVAAPQGAGEVPASVGLLLDVRPKIHIP